MNKSIYLFRHGLATKNKSYRDKIVTAALLPEGIPAMLRLADYLKKIPLSKNLSSEFLRCRQTVEIISRMTGKTFLFDSRLNERYQEKFSDCRTRIRLFYEEMKNFPEENIIICTHGIVIAGLKYFIQGDDFKVMNRYDYPKTGELLIYKNNSFKTISFN